MAGFTGLAALLFGLLCLGTACAMDNGLALVPAMGYNTWNCFALNINEDIIYKTADLMVDLGLVKAGYEYLVIDDAWSEPQRDSKGRLQSNKEKFPSGMLNISNYVHSLDMKFGMYSDAGSLTCGGYPGSRGYEEVDAQSFADWKIDYLKYDNCFAPSSDWVIDRYTSMGDALNKTGRPILYSMCSWGVGDPWTWGPKVGNSWRTTADIANNWDSVLRCLDNNVGLAKYAGPGGWNDPDMLEVGNPGLSFHEQRAHFALWAIMKSPLLIGADLRVLPEDSLQILLAAEVIALNQDPLGVAGDLIWKEGPLEVFACPLKGGGRGIVLFNRHTSFSQYPWSNITVSWSQLGYKDDVKAVVRDLYAEKDLGTFSKSFTGEVYAHDVMALRVTPHEAQQEHESWRPWTDDHKADIPKFDPTRGLNLGRKVLPKAAVLPNTPDMVL